MAHVQGVAATVVHGLVGGGAVHAAVDPGPTHERRERVVDATAPPSRPQACEPVGVTSCDQCLGPAVPALLAEVRTDPGSPVVPDQRRGVEPDLPATVEHLPAEVDVIT